MNNKLEQLFKRKVHGKVILITGASSGIGLTAAHKLADAGAHVLLVARTVDALIDAQKEIEAKGGQASIFPCDLNDMNAIDDVEARSLMEKHGEYVHTCDAIEIKENEIVPYELF